MKLNARCAQCMREKAVRDVPSSADEKARQAYLEDVDKAIAEGGDMSAPEVLERIQALYRNTFGALRDYSREKAFFNALMLEQEDEMLRSIKGAPDPLLRAVQMAMTGNYIDFTALGQIDEAELAGLLAAADQIPVDDHAIAALRSAVMGARSLVMFTDNCGEIVADKVLLKTIRGMNPALKMTVVVRGEDVVNDATEQDARQVHMEEAADRVLGSGSGLSGTVPSRLSTEAWAAFDRSDLILAKGQANYESLSGCGRNVFYIFMCKWDLFTQRFGVPRFAGILCQESKFDQGQTV